MTNEELQALCDAATPGPWHPYHPEQKKWVYAFNEHGNAVLDVQWRNNHWNDAKFIAAARTAIPELLAALAVRELNDATNRIETQMHQLNDAQRESVSLGLRLETAERDQRLLVQLWNAMAHTEQGWRVFVDGDLLREFEQAVLNE